MSEIVIIVSSSDELISALKTAQGGETIKLLSGTYDPINLSSYKMNLTFADKVTITSENPDDPAVLSGLSIHGAKNLAFDGLVFDYTFAAGDQLKQRPFTVASSSDIAFTNSVFDGDVAQGLTEADNGYASGHGLIIRDTQGVTVQDNEFRGFYIGLTLSSCDDSVVSGNEIHSMRMDGMNMVANQGLLIENNYIHDFAGSPLSSDHSDMIQFWSTNATRPSTDVVIRDNILDVGEGTFTQSIFMRNEAVDSQGAGTDMYYQNVTIEGNTIYNSHLHGITVGESNGLEISNNTIIQVFGSNVPAADQSKLVYVPRINVKEMSVGVTIADNITGNLPTVMGAGWVVVGNLILDSLSMFNDTYVNRFFVSSSMTPGADGSHNYVLQTEFAGVGSQAVQPDAELGAGAARFNVFNDPDEPGVMIYDASESRDATGAAFPEGTTFLWSFDDGFVASGRLVSHHYTTPGQHETVLTIILPDSGVVETAAHTVSTSPLLVEFDAQVGALIVRPETDHLAVGHDGAVVSGPPATGAAWLDIPETGSGAKILRKDLVPLFGAQDMQISLTVQADTAGTGAGEIVRLHHSFIITVDATGRLVAQIYTEDGTSSIVRSTGSVSLLDGQAHAIDLHFDGRAGKMTLEVDGILLGEVAAGSKLTNQASWDLTFGNPWGKANFAGNVLEFLIAANSPPYKYYDGTGQPSVSVPSAPQAAQAPDDETSGADDFPGDDDSFVFNSSAGGDDGYGDDAGSSDPGALPDPGTGAETGTDISGAETPDPLYPPGPFELLI